MTTWWACGRGGAGVTALFLSVGLGYYVGGLIGLQLRIPPATPSVLWPPNAILTAVLLITRPRRWALCLAAAFPAHLLVQLPTDWPRALIVALFVTNCGEALIAATLLRRLSDAPARIDTLRRLTAFILAVVIAAPLLSTFADASVVHLFRDEEYWVVWRHRLVANMVAALLIVPAIVGIATHLSAEVRRGPVRAAEAAVLMAGFGLACLGLYSRVQPMLAFPAITALVLTLPFALWAALRFGPTGTSVVLLVFALLISWGVVRRVPQDTDPVAPETVLLLLQALLLLVGITLLTLTAIIEERREAARALSERLRYEELVSRVAGAFVEVSSDRMSATFEAWLGHLGVFLGVDCLRLYYVSEEERDLTVAFAWAAPGFAAVPPAIVKKAFPWTLEQMLDRRSVIVEAASAFPAEAATDRASLGAYGFKAMLVMPLVTGDHVLGALGFGSASERPWPGELVSSLRLATEVFANALVRKQSEDALRNSEARKSAILESLTSGVAVIDRIGQVRTVNTNWAQFMRDSAIVPSPAVRVGDNFLESVRASGPHLSEVMRGVNGILDGSQQRFVFEYVSPGIAGPRWWILQVVRLKEPEGGAVATYSDITERRRAEADAQRSRQDLAHVARVSTIGALVGSLAHQLNQPLAAIMTNAQAAALLLARPQPDLAELRAILADIVDDDRRAAEVIQWVRALLKKGAPSRAAVDLGRVVRDVANLVRSDAVIRNVVVTLDVENTPVVVPGDRVELEQVVLNLLVNALESLDEVPLDRRKILMRCSRVTADLARVLVLDSGRGFQDGPRDHVFEPFHTTKPGGLGMGLSIARTIVEAYGGAIRAGDAAGGGAVVEFTLPLDSSQGAV